LPLYSRIVLERGVRAVGFVALIAWAAASCYGYWRWLQGWGGFGVDFRGTLWGPGRQILAGVNPYPSRVGAGVGWPATYTPPVMLVALPFAKLSFTLAAWLWVAVLSVASAAALFVLRVRDWRCYLASAASAPVFAGITVGNVTPLIVLSAACAWRWREEPGRGAAALGFGLIVKPILWPLVVWALLTRRLRLAFASVALALVVDVVGWAAIGFDGLRNYPSLMSSLAHSAASHGMLLVSTFVNSGASLGVALVPSIVLAALLIGGAAHSRDDRLIFAAALVAAMLLTPVMWIHYLSLLFVPIAMWRRRLDVVWLAPLALWVVARTYHLPEHSRPVWVSLFSLACVALVGLRLLGARALAGRPRAAIVAPRSASP
jgi:alpha-1,2-mannosyltransferase